MNPKHHSERRVIQRTSGIRWLSNVTANQAQQQKDPQQQAMEQPIAKSGPGPAADPKSERELQAAPTRAES